MIRHCIIDTHANKVVNIIEYKEEVTESPPGLDEHLIAVSSEDGQIGADYVSGEIVNPTPIIPSLTYDQLRASEYPPMADYLDGIVKGDQAQIDKYIADCLAVKAKYPKPE